MQMDSGHMIELDKNKVFNAIHPKAIDLDYMAKKNPDLVFHVGERVKVKGGDFKVSSFGRKHMVLEGLPGNRMTS